MTTYRECKGCGWRKPETDDETFFDSVGTADGQHYFQCPVCTSKETFLCKPDLSTSGEPQPGAI